MTDAQSLNTEEMKVFAEQKALFITVQLSHRNQHKRQCLHEKKGGMMISFHVNL